jgi:nucleoside-diphosphate-sugar epimerase
MRIAVTGASGFVGRAVCTAISAVGYDPVSIDLRRYSPPGDWGGATALVHLAAIAHRHASADDLQRINVDLARQMGEAAAERRAPMVYVSSVKVHGERSEEAFTEDSPVSPADRYAESKARAEDALRSIAGLELTILRPPLVYGPCVKANFLALMNALARGLPLPLASIRNRRSLIFVDNLADAILCSLGKSGTFLVSDGDAPSTPELCRRLGAALGRPPRLVPFPPALLPSKLAASLEVDDARIRAALGWSPPFSLDEGLRWTAQWYRDR